MATVEFEDASFPGRVKLTGWSPLIPLNEDDSGIPAAFIEISVINTTHETLEYHVAGSLRNPCEGSVNTFVQTDGGSMLVMKQTAEPAESPGYREMALGTDASDRVCAQTYWY